MLFGFSASLAHSLGQTATVFITVAVQDNARELFQNTIIPEFQKANPQISVQAVSLQQQNNNPVNNVENHLNGLQTLMSQADVVLVRTADVTPEGSRAGYYLDLQPLASSDASLNVNEFYPNVYRAFQWDQGMWALPLGTDVSLMLYDPAAFDKAGVTYPSGAWTLADLINAAKKLTIVDSAGKVVTPGIELFQGNNDLPLYMSLLGKQLVDPNSIPNAPLLDQPEAVALLDALPELYAVVPAQSNTFGQAPMQIGSIRFLQGRGPNQNGVTRKATLLPGGRAYLDVNGVAVSHKTNQPEAAYAFAKFLTTRADLNTRGGSFPARKTLVGQGGNNNAGGLGGFNINLTPELRAIFDNAVENGLSATDRRFYNYFNSAVQKVRAGTANGKTALSEAQLAANTNQNTALARKSDVSKVAIVATPLPTIAPNAGITLKFGMLGQGGGGGGGNQIANRDSLIALGQQYAKSKPGVVARVDIAPIGGGPNAIINAPANFDCFYAPYSVVQTLPLDTILSLDPFLSADSTYNAADFVKGTLTQVTRDNKLYGLPTNVQPTVMWYEPTTLANAGVASPASGWGVDKFADSLKQLAPIIKEGVSPFAAQADLGSSLLMLTATYGGLPIDYRTTPVTVDFTSPANVDAMRQVLDLAKNNLISYSELGRTFGIFIRGGQLDNPIYSQLLNSFNFRPFQNPNAANTANTNFTPVTYPKGTKIQLVAYSVGTLYISANAQNADACYGWIKLLGESPELFNAMPARQSQIESPAMEAKFGAKLTQAYRDIAALLADPNTISAPSLTAGFVNLQGQAVQHWLYEAWDNYVLKGGNLEEGLAKAQEFANGFLQCTAGIPPFDPKVQRYAEYQTALLQCALKVDPSLNNL
jgi:ABC-type glycerol-3-phosphate transport system substrate-binding protein